MSNKRDKNVSNLLQKLLDGADGKRLSIGDVIGQLGSRAFDPIMFIGAVLLISPIGGIPGATAVLGTMILLVAVQSVFTQQPWLPAWVRERSASASKAKKFLKKTIPYLERMEQYTKARWLPLTQGPLQHLSALIIALLAITTYPLGLIPGGLILPGLAIAFLSTARFHSDGLMMLIGWLASTASFGLLLYAAYSSLF